MRVLLRSTMLLLMSVLSRSKPALCFHVLAALHLRTLGGHRDQSIVRQSLVCILPLGQGGANCALLMRRLAIAGGVCLAKRFRDNQHEGYPTDPAQRILTDVSLSLTLSKTTISF